MKNNLTCPHFLKGCGGCQHWHKDYSDEIEIKKNDLKSKLDFSGEIRTAHLNHFNFRTRFDFTIQENQMGLYSKNNELIDLDGCAILHPELEKAFQYFKLFNNKTPLNIKKGSIRIRISADLNKWGLWLDLSNLDIKRLLIEKNILIQLSEKFLIEIGQKKKRLDLSSFVLTQLKLMDPFPEYWFKTLNQKLLCSIPSFTQPSWETADLLTHEIINWINITKPHHIIEYGCGIGQYTLPLLEHGYKVSVFETDLISLDYLKLNAQNFLKHLSMNDFSKIDTSNKTLGLVNPPRSGLGKFSQNIINAELNTLIYISCFPDSLSQDLKILSPRYQIKDILLVDQFARTRHYETAVLLTKK